MTARPPTCSRRRWVRNVDRPRTPSTDPGCAGFAGAALGSRGWLPAERRPQSAPRPVNRKGDAR